MDPGGLHAVSDPSSLFLSNRSKGSSAAVAVLDGTRVLVLEVQVRNRARLSPCRALRW